MTDRGKLQGLYARLRGLSNALPSSSNSDQTIGRDFDHLVSEFGRITGEEVHTFILPSEAYFLGGSRLPYVKMDVLRSKLGQLLSYVEQVYHINAHIIEIGTLYNSIKDEELKRRCSDLLSAPGDFDRVINQATLVLEGRLRDKSGYEGTAVGVNLVSATLNPDPSKTILVVSEAKEEQEGIHGICRGIMLAFRNPTHHYITDQYSREDSLKLCAFIDSILSLVDRAKRKT